jgi:lipopolysaccharide biosynthesis regulator YciM
LAVLTLHERSRDWARAVEAARALEGRGVGSFVNRIAHHRCEQALQALSQGQDDEAKAFLRDAQDVAPLAARPRVLAGDLALRAGRPAQALDVWDALREVAPGAFSLVARAYAQAAQDCGQSDRARRTLQANYAQSPDFEVLMALSRLDAQARPQQADALLWSHLQDHGGLDAVAEGLKRPVASWPEAALPTMARAVDKARAGARRYRCAACGFEARQYFWQCPGCQGWDTFPPGTV